MSKQSSVSSTHTLATLEQVRPDLANIRADTLQGVAVWRLRSDRKRAAWRCDRNSSPSISASRSRHTSIDRQLVTDRAMEAWYHPLTATDFRWSLILLQNFGMGVEVFTLP